MRKHLPENLNPTTAISSFTGAYVIFVTGLKLDGWINYSWTLLLAPVWVPWGLAFILLVVLGVAWVVLWCIITAARKGGGL